MRRYKFDFQAVNINEQIDGRPPILYAADYGQTDVIHYLISAGADVNVSHLTYLTILSNSFLVQR